MESKKEFLKNFLKLTGGIPHYITYERVFSIIDPKELENILNTFISNIVFNIYLINVLNAYSNNYGICLASEMIEEKTNEIPTIPVIMEGTKYFWKGKKTIIKNNETKVEKRYYISSLDININDFSRAIRNH